MTIIVTRSFKSRKWCYVSPKIQLILKFSPINKRFFMFIIHTTINTLNIYLFISDYLFFRWCLNNILTIGKSLQKTWKQPEQRPQQSRRRPKGSWMRSRGRDQGCRRTRPPGTPPCTPASPARSASRGTCSTLPAAISLVFSKKLNHIVFMDISTYLPYKLLPFGIHIL